MTLAPVLFSTYYELCLWLQSTDIIWNLVRDNVQKKSMEWIRANKFSIWNYYKVRTENCNINTNPKHVESKILLG